MTLVDPLKTGEAWRDMENGEWRDENSRVEISGDGG